MAEAGRNIYVDDIVLDVRARTVDRHGGAEWTPGAASWPSGGLAKDVAPKSDMHGNHYDHLGNLAVRTDATGASIATWDYDAFGNVLATTGTATAANYRHTGNHYDPDAGLFYFNNRWYDPALGRFTQRHTPFQPLWEHPYAISEGNPSNSSDSSGFGPTFPGGFNWDDFWDGIHDGLGPQRRAGESYSECVGRVMGEAQDAMGDIETALVAGSAANLAKFSKRFLGGGKGGSAMGSLDTLLNIALGGTRKNPKWPGAILDKHETFEGLFNKKIPNKLKGGLLDRLAGASLGFETGFQGATAARAANGCRQ